MRCVEPGKVRRVLDETPSGGPATDGRWPDSPLATRHSPLFRATRRRGVTLVEMLVTLAVLLLMMTVIVQIFQAATGALNSAQVYQELDNQLRLLDSTIRSDLNGVTARFTPPLNPKDNLGYFEYGENEFADLQGEDSDDYIRFTAKAPAGRPFTGRMWVGPVPLTPTLYNDQAQPITITSEHAEIIYFLRNGNLYRRVLLVAPERQSTIVPASYNNTAGQVVTYYPNPSYLPGNPQVSHQLLPSVLNSSSVGWQAVNDLSAHPAATGNPSINNSNSVILNTLGDLTNRENRWAYQRFSSDFQDVFGTLQTYGDGLTDDGSVAAGNADNVPDYYPTLYPSVLSNTVGGSGPPLNAANQAIQLIYEPISTSRPALAAMAFPFVFPGAYSRPQNLNNMAYGWIHSPEPDVLYNGNPVQFDLSPLGYLQNLNHNPIDLGDNLPLPQSGSPGGFQTWYGFPTWRETLSNIWVDPTVQVNALASQPTGLGYIAASSTVPTGTPLPAMTPTYRINPQQFNDGWGSPSVFFPLDANGNPPPLWSQYSWEDDLIMTGVRSFDIKAYDNSLARYADLGWGDDLRNYPLSTNQNPNNTTTLPFLNGTPNSTLVGKQGFTGLTPYLSWNNQWYDLINQTFAHEGRMPPLIEDNRYDAQYGLAALYLPSNSPYLPVNGGNYTGNIGDDQPAVVRLRRVWDSWSTEYTVAPGTGVNPPGPTGTPFPAASFPAGPPYTPPIYPSYPPPYPAPLRGIQIQIRVTDPTNQRVKLLTIQHDFTDKL